MAKFSVLLEGGLWLRYVTRDGHVEDVRSGRFEKEGDYEVKIFNARGDLMVDLPARDVRSWCVFDALDRPMGNNSIEPADLRAMFVAAPGVVRAA